MSTPGDQEKPRAFTVDEIEAGSLGVPWTGGDTLEDPPDLHAALDVSARESPPTTARPPYVLRPPRLATHRFALAIGLLVVFAATNFVALAGWLSGHDIEPALPILTSVSTLVGAVFAFYFASERGR